MSDDTKDQLLRSDLRAFGAPTPIGGTRYFWQDACDEAADTIERLERELTEARADRDALAERCEKLRKDAARLDVIERCIRDGSYRSILNDIIAVCEHSYANFGSEPVLRSAIDCCLAAPKDAP